MTRDIDYEGDIEVYFGGYGSAKYIVAFTINYNFEAYVAATRHDPAEGSAAWVNSVRLRRNGEIVDCPSWLEEMILDAVDVEVLVNHAMENA